jgi:UDP-galactopyranose mutase
MSSPISRESGHAPGPPFQSFLQAGFECSTQKLKGGRRVDVVAASLHDTFAKQDYQRLRAFGIRTAREGLRWYLIEKAPGRYDFSSAQPMLEAAQSAGVEVIWDLMHFGWPDHWDVFEPSFISAFRDFSLAAVHMLSRYRVTSIFVAPVNEISFLSWAAGSKGFFYPFARFRGRELKKQLVAAAIAASKAILADFPAVRLIAPEPVIHILAQPERPRDTARANRYRLSMFEAWDMLAGRVHPELGGDESCLDIIGVNYYDRNQWFHLGRTIPPDDPCYRPFAEILQEVYERYERPMLVSETGAEDEKRVLWFRYVRDQVQIALAAGVDLHGLCLYPIVNHPGWDDDRHCQNGLWDYASQAGVREIYQPLALELHRDIFISQTFMNTLNIPALNPFSKPDLLCFSHLRWNFVFQRPQHLMSRFGRERRVFYVEEPIFENALDTPYWEERICAQSGVHILVPHLPEARHQNSNLLLRQLVFELIESRKISQPLLWFYTAMALEFVPEEIESSLVIYDCMDELSAFQNAPAAMRNNENRMFTLADLVFTGGFSLFEAKRERHARVFPFPSGVDLAHFSQSRRLTGEGGLQRDIPQPRIGFAGVIDERMDLPLLAEIAQLRPHWQLVMVGPVVKIDPATLPNQPSIHWLGMQDYAGLPQLFAGWDVAMMPFALNESTRFISPTKTPEYLAAGLPVVSTPIRDVVHPYETMGLARIAASAADFVHEIEEALLDGKSADRQKRADEFLKSRSWDETWHRMNELIETHADVEPPQASSEDIEEEAA